ncbi:MAG: aminopeptidase [Candidatus Bathyarchaeia archaeon]
MGSNMELAHQILDVCLNVGFGENVWIQSWDHTVELASDLALACLKRGAHPFITLMLENYWMRSLIEASKELLEILPTHQSAALEKTDVFIFTLGPRKPIRWNTIPQEKRELANVWFYDSNKFLESWRKIAQKHCVRMLGIEYCLVTQECAEALGLDYEQWRKVMLNGCLANQQEISDKAAKLAGIIKNGREVKIQTPFGTNLKFDLAGREPIIGDSIVTKEDATKYAVKFLPSGFVEVATDEDSAEGIVVFDVEISAFGGRKIKDLKLWFERGNVIKYWAREGIDLFENYIESNQGDIRKFGFFGLGLNPGLKHGFTQDDKVLGGVTIGIGGNKDKGGKNITPENRRWWASMTHATVWVDGKLILKGTPTF